GPLIGRRAAGRRGPREPFVGGSIGRRVGHPQVAARAATGRAEGATLFMASFAALAVLLSRYADLDDLHVGSAVANRAEPNSREVLGMIVNTIVLRVGLRGDATVAELLRRVRPVALEA